MKLNLPRSFRKAGLWMIAIGVIGMWFVEANGLINVYRVIAPAQTLPDGSYPYPVNFQPINQAIGWLSLVSLLGGLLGFFFAKETDEYMYRVRLESLQVAFVSQIVLTICLGTYYLLKVS